MVSWGGVSRPSASKSLKNPRPTVPPAARSLTRVASSSRPGVTKKNFVYAMFTPRWLPANPVPLPFMALRFRIGGSGPGQKRPGVRDGQWDETRARVQTACRLGFRL